MKAFVTAMWSTKILKERVVAFPLQEWLPKHIAYLVLTRDCPSLRGQNVVRSTASSPAIKKILCNTNRQCTLSERTPF